MKKQFVTYEIALKLKELGFDEECFGYYSQNDTNDMHYLCIYQEEDYFLSGDVPSIIGLEAPLWQQAIDWCDLKGLLVGTIIVGNKYKSTINNIKYEGKLFNLRNESIRNAIEFAISYLQDNK